MQPWGFYSSSEELNDATLGQKYCENEDIYVSEMLIQWKMLMNIENPHKN